MEERRPAGNVIEASRDQDGVGVDPTDGASGNNHAIARVSVDNLFGDYVYDLHGNEKRGFDLSRLFIMYGENGTGKTTILKLIYHALSPQNNEGHRTFLAQTKFNRFSIELFDGTVFEANRRATKGGGSLLLTLRRDSRTLSGVELEIDGTHAVPSLAKMPESQSEGLKDLLTQLSQLNIKLHYLSDDRRHLGSLRQAEFRPIVGANSRYVVRSLRSAAELEHIGSGFSNFIDNVVTSADVAEDSLAEVMARVVAWVQRQVRRGATKGEGDVYSIYSNVVSDIAHSLEKRVESLDAEVEKVVATLHELRATSKKYSVYGLAPELPIKSLVENINQSNETTRPVIYTVMKPHVDGIKARLNAVSDVYTVIHRFMMTINSFYRNKEICFHVDSGFAIRTSKTKLQPDQLSSGEKQLFLLLCHTLLARKHASLFLIDEPELSLNVKWQRKLLQAILDNTEGTNVQFLLATHSIELISQHRTSVVRLVDTLHEEHRKGTTGEAGDDAGGPR